MSKNEKGFDRSQLSNLSADDFTQQSKEQKEIVQSSYSNNNERIPFFTIKEGVNIRRVMPAHPDTRTVIATKTVSWLPVTVWVDANDRKKEIYQPTDEQISKGEVVQDIKRKPIFNARIHFDNNPGVSYKGQSFKDFVEFYIFYATEQVKETMDPTAYSSKKEYNEALAKKLDPILNWKMGITPKTSFIYYCLDIDLVSKTRIFGKQEISSNLKEHMNTMSMSNENGKPIMKDVFSHPDTGKAIQITYDPNEKDNKKKYQSVLLWQDEYPLTDDEIEVLMQAPSLKEQFVDSYKHSDFVKQLSGIQNLDTQHKYGYWNHSDVQKMVEKFAEIMPKEEESNDESESNNNDEENTSENSNPFLSMDRSELMGFVEYHDLELLIKDRHSDDKVAEMIYDELVDLEKGEDDIVEMIQEYLSKKTENDDEESDESETEDDEEKGNVTNNKEVKNQISNMKDKYKGRNSKK